MLGSGSSSSSSNSIYDSSGTVVVVIIIEYVMIDLCIGHQKHHRPDITVLVDWAKAPNYLLTNSKASLMAALLVFACN